MNYAMATPERRCSVAGGINGLGRCRLWPLASASSPVRHATAVEVAAVNECLSWNLWIRF